MQEQTVNYPGSIWQMLQGWHVALSSFAARKPKPRSYFGSSLHTRILALWSSTCNEKPICGSGNSQAPLTPFGQAVPRLVLSTLPRSPTQAMQLMHPHIPPPAPVYTLNAMLKNTTLNHGRDLNLFQVLWIEKIWSWVRVTVTLLRQKLRPKEGWSQR